MKVRSHTLYWVPGMCFVKEADSQRHGMMRWRGWPVPSLFTQAPIGCWVYKEKMDFDHGKALTVDLQSSALTIKQRRLSGILDNYIKMYSWIKKYYGTMLEIITTRSYVLYFLSCAQFHIFKDLHFSKWRDNHRVGPRIVCLIPFDFLTMNLWL